MKKKEKNEGNLGSQPLKDLDYLQKKLGEEKENLARENKKLQRQIHEEIQQNRMLKISYEKKEQVLQHTIQELRQQVDNFKTQLILNQQDDREEQLQQCIKQALENSKKVNEQNDRLKKTVEDNADFMLKLEEEVGELQKENLKYRKKLKEEEVQIKTLAREIDESKLIRKKLLEQSENTVKELDKQIEQNMKLEKSLAHYKSKNKQFTQMIKSLEEKYENYQRGEAQRVEEEIFKLKRAKDELQSQIVNKERQIQFLKLSVGQKQSYAQLVAKELNEHKKQLQNWRKQHNELALNFQKIENENRRLNIQIENEKSRCSKQIQESNKTHEQQIVRAKRKVAEELNILMRTSGDNRLIENYMESLRVQRSQSNLRGNNAGTRFEEKSNPSFQKFRYQNQILNLGSEIENLRRQIQGSSQEISRLKKQIDDKNEEIEDRNAKIKQSSLTYQKLQYERDVEQQKLHKQLVRLKNVETELLEAKKSFCDLQQAGDLKIAYYDKKIKEQLDSIDRKDSIIENMRNSKAEVDNRCKFLEDKLAKVIEELETLRRFRNDTNRKQDLLGQYKQKMQKTKEQNQALKSEIEKIRKEKTRLQKNLESKEEYIGVLKNKIGKQQQEKEQQSKQQKLAKEVKQKYESKLKKLKKQVQEFEQIVCSIKSVIVEKIQEVLAKNSTQREKADQNWQGAKLLGLKSSQIQQFVNPDLHIDKHICAHLEQMWESRQYELFMRSSLEYLLIRDGDEVG